MTEEPIVPQAAEEAAPEPAAQPGGYLRRRRHRSHRENPTLKFVRRFWFEILWVLAVMAGIFLILERVNLRERAASWVMAGVRALDHSQETLLRSIAHVTLSDAVGAALLLAALVSIVLRVRWQIMRSEALTSAKCPKCGGSIHRVHRHFRDHLIDVYVPVRRYRCARRECHWEGLRVEAHPHSSSSSQVKPASGCLAAVIVIGLVLLLVGFGVIGR